MSGIKAGPSVPSWLAAAVVGLLIGGVGGYYGAKWNDSPAGGGTRPGGGGAMGGPGGGGGGGMMGGGGGGAQAHPQAAALIRTVSSLATLEKARGQELSGEQRTKLAKTLEPLASGTEMSEADCDARLKEINAILTPTQVTTVDELLPRPGGRGGGGGAPGGGAPPAANAPSTSRPVDGNTPGQPSRGFGMAGNMPVATAPGRGGMGGPGGGMMGGMGGGPGGGIDYEKPFAGGRGKDRLTELLASLKN